MTLRRDSVNARGLAGQSFFRIGAVALVLCTLSFAAGVAGDLSEPPTSGVRVVVRIPPELPADAVRAGPIAQVLTSTAAAAEIRRPPRQLRAETLAPPVVEVIAPVEKPRRAEARADVKIDLDRGPKPADAL